MNRNCYSTKLVLCFSGFFLLFASGVFAEKTPLDGPQGIQYFVQFEHKGDFLKDPESLKSEFFRRMSRQIANFLPLFHEGSFSIAGFPAPAENQYVPLYPPINIEAWTKAQKALCDGLIENSRKEISLIKEEISLSGEGFTFEGAVDPFQFPFPKLESSSKDLKIKQFVDRISFAQEFVKFFTFAGSLSIKEFKGRFDIVGSSKFPAARVEFFPPPAAASGLSKFLDSTALFNYYQLQKAPDPETILAGMREMPQSAIIEGYLASAGLSFEKDILPLSAEEIAIMGNLSPLDQSGIPDFRILGQVRNVAKLIQIAPAIKQLGSNLGVFMEIKSDPIFSCKVKYFMLPQVALFFTLVDSILVVTTGYETLIETAKRINEIRNSKISPFEIPKGINRYWKIRFSDFNEQLQRLIQSPLLADKGIPPIPNITAFKELGDFSVTSSVETDRIIIRVDLPFNIQ